MAQQVQPVSADVSTGWGGDRRAPRTPGKQAGQSALGRAARQVLVWVPLVALAAWTILPFLITVSISLKTRGEVFSSPDLIPNDPSFAAYREVFVRPGFGQAFLNSVIVGIGTSVITLVLAVPAAYAFARFKFRGRHLLLLFTLIPRLIPNLGLMIPLYLLAAKAGVLDTRITLMVVYAATLLPIAAWLLVGFIQQIPRELEEAANVDGCSMWQRIRYMVLPLCVPAMITIGVLCFREAWNEFTLVLVLTSTPGKRTLPYELFLMQGTQGIENYPAEAAFAILTILPFILIYTRIEKYVVSGITSGAVK